MYRYVQVAAGLPPGTWLLTVAESSAPGGADLTGIAAIIASSAGVISALAGAISLLRTKRAQVEDVRSDVLLEILVKALEDERVRGGGAPPSVSPP